MSQRTGVSVPCCYSFLFDVVAQRSVQTYTYVIARVPIESTFVIVHARYLGTIGSRTPYVGVTVVIFQTDTDYEKVVSMFYTKSKHPL